MPCLIPEHPTTEQHTALLAMTHPQQRTAYTRRLDLLAQLDRCETADEISYDFEMAVIDHGGTWIPALGPCNDDGTPRSHRNTHAHEVQLLGVSGSGATLIEAIAVWRKAAQRMGAA